MKNISLFFLICALYGCATTQSIQEGKNLSASGIAYTDAVDKLVEASIDKVIDFDSEELKKTRYGSESELEKIINSHNNSLSQIVFELERFQKQTKLLKAYFVALQSLADSSVKNDAGESVKALSGSINEANKENGGESQLSEDQLKQVGILGGIIANSIHAGKIKSALMRDSTVIGMSLALQENQLTNLTNILQDRLLGENELFLNESVIYPYINSTSSLDKNWMENRKKWVKFKFIDERLDTAQEAVRQLRGVWEDILKGEDDVNSVGILISDLNDFVNAIISIRDVDIAN